MVHTCKQIRRHGRFVAVDFWYSSKPPSNQPVEPVAAARETVVGSYHAHLIICYRTSKHYS